jgi:hypothetical protein
MIGGGQMHGVYTHQKARFDLALLEARRQSGRDARRQEHLLLPFYVTNPA